MIVTPRSGALIRDGHYQAWNDPGIWGDLCENIDQVSGEDLVLFLSKVEAFDREVESSGGGDGYDDYEDEYYEDEYYEDEYYDDYDSGPETVRAERLVENWPIQLDTMVVYAHHKAPELLASKKGEFNAIVQEGMKVTEKRLGLLDEEIPNIAQLLANQFVGDYGLPWRVLTIENGEITELTIGSHDENGDAAMAKFIAFYTDPKTWGQEVLKAVTASEYGPSFRKTREAWPIADRDQLKWLLEEVSAYNQEQEQIFELVLARDDAPADLLTLAAEMNDRGAEVAAICATIKAARAGAQPDPKALDYITFGVLGYPTYRGDAFTAMSYMTEALEALPEEKLVEAFRRQFEGDYTKTRPFPMLHLMKENETLMQLAFDIIKERVKGDDVGYGSEKTIIQGLSLFGPSSLPMLKERYDVANDPKEKDVYALSMMGIIADADQAPDETFDAFVAITNLNLVDDYWAGSYVNKDYAAALDTIGERRAERRLVAELNHDNSKWYRALRGVASAPTQAVFDRAFTSIGNAGMPPTADHDFVGPIFYELKEQVEPFIGAALAAIKSPDFHNLVQRQWGDEAYEKILAASGAETVADKSLAEKIQRLSNAFFEANPDAKRTAISIFERLDDAPDGSTLNRIGGAPYGITLEEWPGNSGDPAEPMEHMITVDLDTVPSLKAMYQDDVRAVSLFVKSPQHNEAWTPGNGNVDVRPVMRDNCGLFEGDLPTGSGDARAFSVEDVVVPVEAFVVPYDGDSELRAIKNAIYQAHGRAGGAPIWLQGDDYWGPFLFQFDEALIWMNLGDCGLMYVFADTAFWQCH